VLEHDSPSAHGRRLRTGGPRPYHAPMEGAGPATPALRVLVVDDHDLFRGGLHELLADAGLDVRAAGSGEEALRLAESFGPTVVLMDLQMPGMSGIDATRRLVERAPDTRVVILTATEDEASVTEAIRAGAFGYLLKETSLAEIVTAIHAAAANESVLSSRVTRGVMEIVRRSRRENGNRPAAVVRELSTRERVILTLVAEGFDNAEIAERLFLSPSTVKSHVSRILDKLGVENRVQAAVFAVHAGLLPAPD
jgi:DNA-binding NarL/FixJ family response regulator